MRYLVSLMAGLVLGALLASMLASVLHRRNAWPRAIMTVMAHELGRARDATRKPACSIAEADAAADHLVLLSRDIEPALLAPDVKDRVFSQYAEDLRDAVATFAAAGTDCPARQSALTKVSNACDACHRDYQ